MVSFTLSPDETEVREQATLFASNVLADAPLTYGKHATQIERFRSTREFYSQAVKDGILKRLIPSTLGGTRRSLLETAILVEELYTVETSVSLNLFSTALGLGPLVAGGSPEQQAEFLKPFLCGEGEPLASLVLSEPAGSANWLEKGGAGLQTVAWEDESSGDWIIDGEKMWASNSSGWDDRGADVQCVVCRHVQNEKKRDQEPLKDPKDSILILLVSPETINNNKPSAYQIVSHPELAGHRAVSGPHVRFNNMRVPAKNLLAAPGRGTALIQPVITESAALVGSMSVGIMRAAFEAALKFAKVDTRGASIPIIARQSVTDLLMDIKMKCDASRALTWAASHALDDGLGPELAIEAKIFGSDNAVKCVVDAMNLVGMSSYAKESPYPRLMDDALCLPLFSGGNIGVRRRQLEKIIAAKNYKPWTGMLT